MELRQVICMQMPPLPDHKRSYSAVVLEVDAPHSAKASVADLEGVARTLLRGMKPRLLVVAEAHNLLAGNYR